MSSDKKEDYINFPADLNEGASCPGKNLDTPDLFDREGKVGEPEIALMRAALDATHEPILITDLSGAILYYNQRFRDFWGSAAENIDRRHLEVVQNISSLFPAGKDHLARLEEIYQSTTDAVDQYELNSGRVIKRFCSVHYADNKPIGRIWTFLDITSERLVKDAALRLAAVVESSDDAIISKDLNGRITSWNRGAEIIFGYVEEEVLGKPITMLFPPESIEGEDKILARIRRGERVEHYETERVRKDGGRIDVSLRISPIEDASGRVIGASKIARDITERKRSEEAVRRSERELRAMADSISPLAWIADRNGRSFWFNRRWFQYTGSSFSEIEGLGWLHYLYPEQRSVVAQRWQHCLATGESFEMEIRLRGADGKYRWFLSRINPLHDESGEILRWFGTNSDVHRAKGVESALRQRTSTLQLLNETGRRLNSTLELNELLQIITDAATKLSRSDFGIFYYNGPNEDFESFGRYHVSGLTQETLQNKVPADTYPVDLENPIRIEDTATDERYSQWSRYLNLPLDLRAIRSFMGVPVISRSGKVLGALFFGHKEPKVFNRAAEQLVIGIAAQAAVAIDNAQLYKDLRVAAEEREELLQAERSARTEAERVSLIKDEFLATLSHELRTPLNAILGWSQLLSTAGGDPAYLREGLEVIERNARAQTQLIEDLLDMNRIVAGKISLDVQRIHLLEVIEAAVDAALPAAEAKSIRLRKILDPNAGPVSGDPTRLQQIFWNLLTNAVKFTPKGGRIEVLLERVNSHLEIIVSDSGIGIKAEDLPYIFERFRQIDSSTTRSYSGLGLGLAIVKHLVELHGGTVSAESDGEGKGAVFVVALPLAPVHNVEEREHPTSARGSSGLWPELSLEGIKVLLVDDEPDARTLISRVLSQYKAAVDTAASAEEAMLLIRKSKPDILISDIGMPGTDGYSFIRALRKLPREDGGRIPAIALTAFARSEDRTRAMMAGYQVHIAKPIEPRELAATVGSLAGRMDNGLS